MNSYGGNFVNDDWSPGFAGPEGVGALSRLFSFIPYMPAGVAEFDTDQEVQVMLEGKCTALTEYTGLAQRIDDPASSKVVGKISAATTPKQEMHGPADRHLHRQRLLGRQEYRRGGAVPGVVHLQRRAARIRPQVRRCGGDRHGAQRSGSGEGSSLAAGDRPDSVNNSVQKPRTPDEPKMEDILGTHLNEALVEAIAAKANYDAIAQKHLTAAAGEITGLSEDSRAAISKP